MAKMANDYISRVYAGFLGKIIGIRHGSNIEGWTYEQIEEKYGEISDYLFDFKNFAADDDSNGPLFFIRALDDYCCGRDITAREIGLTWLNYAPYEHGFYWWGGYGRSTEHTAYLNMRSGMEAPRCGSIAQNGAAIAEQIGGQIFIDSWGLVVPGDYKLAAEYAYKAASVAHDGNGIYGGVFIAAAISAAFIEKDIKKVIECGLSVIPSDCEYSRMARDVIAFHQAKPDDWRSCFRFVQDKYGYHRYPGNCHIIPNSAVIVLSLLYGEGDFSKSINISNMCGWDTDCNVGNVGTIIGVMNGIDGIDSKWRTPINDFLASSSVIGSLNIANIPDCAYYIASLGYRLAGEQPPTWCSAVPHTRMGFDIKGATHAMRPSGDDVTAVQCAEVYASGQGSLMVTAKLGGDTDNTGVCYQTYYRPDDFNDSRYDPCFSPVFYPGQTMTATVMLQGGAADVKLYAVDINHDKTYASAPVKLAAGQWQTVTLTVPAIDGGLIGRVGLGLAGSVDVTLYIDNVVFDRAVNYSIDFAKERIENWCFLHQEVSQFTYLKGHWSIEDGQLSGISSDFAEAYTGDYYWDNYEMTATMTPKMGSCHQLNVRVQGAIRSYALRLGEDNTLGFYKNDNGYTLLAKVDFAWEHNHSYTFTIRAEGNKLTALQDGKELLAVTDAKPYLYGQVGASLLSGSHCHYDSIRIVSM